MFFALNYINLPDISILCSWGYLRSDFKQNKTGIQTVQKPPKNLND
ncbi:hypothetical protein HMPREF1581_00959 [Gardnerella vaginalis JCP8108]|uniref:Uncharacterized protein n=1 Tax=Gardnerella vaginalis JCP8108 TaxID=1261066 RepID=S4GVZ4_GARVA|nr:hypothetical protein HMPREF1581_00959 [Gardnerella vaginalis JCP8108]